MYTAINGWTKEKMKAQINKRMLDHPSRVHMCLYRAPDGNACGVGCFIPDDQYETWMDSSWDGFSVHFLSRKKPTLEGIMPLGLHALMHMQQVHDEIPADKDPRPILCQWIDENVEDPQ